MLERIDAAKGRGAGGDVPAAEHRRDRVFDATRSPPPLPPGIPPQPVPRRRGAGAGPDRGAACGLFAAGLSHRRQRSDAGDPLQHRGPARLVRLRACRHARLPIFRRNRAPAQIAAAPAIAEPGAQETAIELPYRLTLSPNHNVAWRHATAPVTYSSRTELWHTRLPRRRRTARQRAVDARTPRRCARSGRPTTIPPVRSIRSRSRRWRPTIPTARRHRHLAERPASDRGPDLGVPRLCATHNNAPFVPTPVEAQMLMLSPLGGWLRSRGHWDPPHGAALHSMAAAGVFGRSAAGRGSPAAKRPKPAPAGGSMPTRNRTRICRPPRRRRRQPLRQARSWRGRRSRRSRPGIPITGEQLDLSEWVHIAAQGRDHYVRIVYEGHLYPFGHRAALIKITERKFGDTAVPEGGTTPVAP